ncbi:zinc ribbon domain-containing protein [Petralouisia muris]|uniref:Zinc ribbon domain-containing protein n=1 Tax=Petralouisia muris TaxID=3032872 RepID=A0AC61RPS0_9FIRM|nr:zinc ribbon domain-containing protein [Petralouisia muris]TGY91001.1 zinc ribbon domain-containing protein [Petralouisia muris]
MALIKCSECGKEISDKATICPNCGMPLRLEDRGTYDVIITREKQWFLVNPKIKVTVDTTNEYILEKNSSITVPLTTGAHTMVFSSGIRKTQTNIDVTENMNINVKFNRATGEIDVNGYKTVSQTNSPNISIGIGGGLFKGGN